MAEDEQQAAAPASGPAVKNVNELKTLFSNLKADIPIFYEEHSKDSITAKFMFDRIKIAQPTYYWLDAASACNFKLALRGKSVDWLNYIRDTKQTYWFNLL